MPNPKDSTHELRAETGRVVVGCWLRASLTWCDFKLFRVSSWSVDDAVISWSQIREEETCDLFDCTEMTASDPVIEGYIKWDGCIEFEVPRQHRCDGPESIAEFHTQFQWVLRMAHAAMGGRLEWEPLA